MRKVLFAIAAGSMLSGCSLIPYENEFSCQLEDNYGKCIDVSSAYQEAVTGIEKHPHMVKASEREDSPVRGSGIQTKEERLNGSANRPMSSRAQHSTHVVPAIDPNEHYRGYRESVYKKLQGLVEQPRAPMIKEPRAVRTMILPYSSQLEKNRLYMPRFVYSIVEEPRFVMGEYLYKRPELAPSLFQSSGGEGQ